MLWTCSSGAKSSLHRVTVVACAALGRLIFSCDLDNCRSLSAALRSGEGGIPNQIEEFLRRPSVPMWTDINSHSLGHPSAHNGW